MHGDQAVNCMEYKSLFADDERQPRRASHTYGNFPEQRGQREDDSKRKILGSGRRRETASRANTWGSEHSVEPPVPTPRRRVHARLDTGQDAGGDMLPLAAPDSLP